MLYMMKWTLEEPLSDGKTEQTEHQERFADISAKYTRGQEWAFVWRAARKQIGLVAEAASQAACDSLAERIRERLGVKVGRTACSEATLSEMFGCLNAASRRDLISEAAERSIRERYACVQSRDIAFRERLLTPKKTFPTMIKEARECYLSESLAGELKRVEQGFQGDACFGHPTHYEIMGSREDIGKALCDSVLEALVKVGRLKSTRVTQYILSEQNEFSSALYENLYQSSVGGTVEITVDGTIRQWIYDEVLPGICLTARRYMDKVLTVFRYTEGADRAREEIVKKLGAFPLVRLDDSTVSGEFAERYLRRRSREYHLRPDKALLAAAQTSLTASELDERVEAWYIRKLQKTKYPQYVPVLQREEAQPEGDGDAMNELSQLIGLEEIKATVTRIVRFCKARTQMAAQGHGVRRPSMHMVFTGNPGTAKTTVARLMAKVLAENGVLDSGRFHEVGRADLIGKYVGHTAPLVREAFAKAKGGLLFIDEAYSLVDERRGLFGDEAINTIVQEMENHRDDTIVVFAGYPEPMESFLDRNVGLRSRVAFHVSFPDYSVEELCCIAESIAAQDGLTLNEEAKDRLRPLFASACREKDFGNGRYARKVIEQACMAQANRLFDPERGEPDPAQLCVLTAEDIACPSAVKSPRAQPLIGFCG